MSSNFPKKIIIIGVSCSGKTSLGRRLEEELGLPMTDIDDLYWFPGWVKRDKEDFIQCVDAATRGDEWILTGNYRETQAMTFSRADMILWLDVPLPTLLWRGVRRALRLARTKQPVCNGNYESYSRILFHRDSILKFIIKGYFKKKKRYRALLDPMNEHSSKLLYLRSNDVIPSEHITRFLKHDQYTSENSTSEQRSR